MKGSWKREPDQYIKKEEMLQNLFVELSVIFIKQNQNLSMGSLFLELEWARGGGDGAEEVRSKYT